MVGVPRSKACLRCLQRRVKCDETRPGCSRCLTYGAQCPGYDRGLKFQDQTRSVAQRHGGRGHPTHTSTMDEGLAPSLAQSTVDMQTQESFARWMQYHFPIYAASFNCRVDVDWMDFIRGRWSTFPQALVWAVRALTTLHRGTTQRDEQAIMCARHMYSRGIRHLGSLLQTRAALSDETLAAAILLGGYEVLDGSSQWSWIAHCRGITRLLCARGPAAHRRGIGRTLLLCWRPYIVADAFIHAIPCFLGDHEWALILMSEDVAKEELQRQKGSLLGQTMDYAFVEVAKCPGYLAAAKDLVAPIINSQSNNKAENLMDDMLFTRENLVRYSKMLETNDPDPSFVGVIPSIHAGPLVQRSRDGLSFAISLVDQLLAILQAHLARRTRLSTSEIPENSGHDSWHLTTQYHTSRSKSPLPASRTNSEDLDLDSRDVQDQLDKFSLTMGLGSLLPDACGCPQFAAHKSLPF